MAQLKIIFGPGAGRSADLVEGEVFTIGRKPRDAEARDVPSLPLEDRRVSRLHCELRWAESCWTLRDLGSANGTFVGGERTEERALRHGDLVQVGSVVLEFLAEPSGAGAGAPEEELPARTGAGLQAGTSAPARRRPAWGVLGPAAATLAAVGLGALVWKTLLVDAPAGPAPGAVTPAAKEGARVAPGGKRTPSRIPGPEAPSAPAEETSEAAAREARDLAEAALKEGDFRRALSVVEGPLSQDPGELEALREKVMDAARAEVERVRRDAEKLAGLGDFDAARESLQALFSRVPESLAESILAPMEELARAEGALRDAREQVEGGAGEARLHLAHLDFAAAEEALRRFSGSPGASGEGTEKAVGESRRTIRHLQEEMALAREAWEALAAVVDDRIHSGAAVPLSFAGSARRDSGDPEPEPEPAAEARWRIVRRDGDFLDLEPAAGSDRKPMSRPVLALSDSQLRLFLGMSSAGPSRRSALREGLGILLLHRCGPERARAFLLAGEVPEDRRARYSAAIAEVGDLWIEARAAELLSRLRALESGTGESVPGGAGPSESGAAWGELSERAAAFIGDARESAAYAPRRKAIGDLFLRARTRALEHARKGACFSATRVEWKGEAVRLAYEFSSDGELRDFTAPGGGTPRFRREGGALVLAGECRLLAGEPFEERIAVKVKVPAGGCDPSSPNINVALFTRAAEELSPESLRPRSLLGLPPVETGSEPDDFLVFGLGYRAAVAQYGGRSIEELKVPGGEAAVKLPAHVLLACRSGRPLHSDAREPLWAQALPGKLQGPLGMEVSLDSRGLSWKVNGRSLLPARAPGLQRIRERKKERVGSVTFFTHGSRVRFESIEVEAVPRKAWLQKGIREEALRALRELDPAAR